MFRKLALAAVVSLVPTFAMAAPMAPPAGRVVAVTRTEAPRGVVVQKKVVVKKTVVKKKIVRKHDASKLSKRRRMELRRERMGRHAPIARKGVVIRHEDMTRRSTTLGAKAIR